MVRAAGFLSVAALLALSCRASGPRLTRGGGEEDAGPMVIETPDAGMPDSSVPEAQPHALLAVDPPHGPFSGGSLVLLRGNGFTSNAVVWFGATQVPQSDVVPIDAHRIQVLAPPGDPGLSDVVVQNGEDASTRVTLEGGYAYDAFYAEPNSGPTSGGTLITLHGVGTQWDESTTVSIDRNPCDVVSVASPSALTCRAPAGTPGAKPVRVTTGDGVAVDVLDGFTYGNSDNGFRGGLSGAPLQHQLKVLVFGAVGGEAVAKASVIVGSDASLVAQTDSNGVALIQSSDLGPKATVTVARRCFQPITFVDVGVDALTVYLDPVLSPVCADPEGDLERGGGTAGQTTSVRGELVWPENQEFRMSGFSNVPEPKSPSEARAAYVFSLSSNATAAFRLPGSASAVTPESTIGTTGYRFNLTTFPGNYTLYALAGIENRSRNPPSFSAYAMGLLRGVAVPAGAATSDVFIRVDVPLDHALLMNVTGPKPTPVGPDVLAASVAIRVGTEGYAILPGGQQLALLGKTQKLSFVGVPALTGSLSGTSYVATAQAVTGATGGLPRSVLGLLGTTSTDLPLTLGPFVEVPQLANPPRNGAWDGRNLAWDFAAGGLPADLAVVDITTAAGLYDWRVVSPAGTRNVTLPDLGAVAPELAWPNGEQAVSISLAKITAFDYANLRYRDLTERGWTAYASDAFFATY
ncbi:MAG: IPT/TIG domain-containing protein [Polyangiaceae bacterium]